MPSQIANITLHKAGEGMGLRGPLIESRGADMEGQGAAGRSSGCLGCGLNDHCTFLKEKKQGIDQLTNKLGIKLTSDYRNHKMSFSIHPEIVHK